MTSELLYSRKKEGEDAPHGLITFPNLPEGGYGPETVRQGDLLAEMLNTVVPGNNNAELVNTLFSIFYSPLDNLLNQLRGGYLPTNWSGDTPPLEGTKYFIEQETGKDLFQKQKVEYTCGAFARWQYANHPPLRLEVRWTPSREGLPYAEAAASVTLWKEEGDE